MRSPYVEQWLESLESEWKYVEGVKFSDLEKTPGAQNPVRQEELNRDRVTVIAESIRRGNQPDAVVLWSVDGNPPYGKIDGYHRLDAFRTVTQELFDAYILVTDDERVLDEARFSANAIGPMPVPEEVRVDSALRLMRKYNLSVEKAAARVCVLPSTVTLAKHADEVRTRLLALGCPMPGVSRTSLRELLAVKSDVVLLAAGKLVSEGQLPCNDVAALTTMISKRRSERDMLIVVEEFRERPEVQERIAKVARIRRRGTRKGTSEKPKRRETAQWIIWSNALRTVETKMQPPRTPSMMGCTKAEDKKYMRSLTKRVGLLLLSWADDKTLW